MSRNVIFALSLFACMSLVFSALNAPQAHVLAQDEPIIDVPVVSTPPATGPHSDIPIERQTCDELEETFDWGVDNFSRAQTAYRVFDCDQLLENPNATASEKATCTRVLDLMIYWHNFSAAVRSVGILKGCPWA